MFGMKLTEKEDQPPIRARILLSDNPVKSGGCPLEHRPLSTQPEKKQDADSAADAEEPLHPPKLQRKGTLKLLSRGGNGNLFASRGFDECYGTDGGVKKNLSQKAPAAVNPGSDPHNRKTRLSGIIRIHAVTQSFTVTL